MPTIATNEKSRARTAVIGLVCIALMPMIAVVLLGQAIIGSKLRALKMAVALDQCGNAATGGSEDETISSRTGRAYQAGRSWAKVAMPIIDFFFGDGHCIQRIGF